MVSRETEVLHNKTRNNPSLSVDVGDDIILYDVYGTWCTQKVINSSEMVFQSDEDGVVEHAKLLLQSSRPSWNDGFLRVVEANAVILLSGDVGGKYINVAL
mmetsp:Transcript_40928/g.47856  ORF Transcript_40928/g.47856 Transcript_40928/m.47856 type:complete len:101 (-) Transcript_40928:1793-2095(-)